MLGNWDRDLATILFVRGDYIIQRHVIVLPCVSRRARAIQMARATSRLCVIVGVCVGLYPNGQLCARQCFGPRVCLYMCVRVILCLCGVCVSVGLDIF